MILQREMKKKQEEEEEDDPLDAFMAGIDSEVWNWMYQISILVFWYKVNNRHFVNKLLYTSYKLGVKVNKLLV